LRSLRYLFSCLRGTWHLETGPELSKPVKLWYQQGQKEFQAGNVESAIASFRSATTADHDNATYMMALATALAADNHVEEARQALLRLRVSAPENGEINLSLARLAGREGKTPEAIRYYHNALYGVWPPDEATGQRVKVRTELVRFLLAAHENGGALSELLILAADTPDNASARVNCGFGQGPMSAISARQSALDAIFVEY
jgi:tetratricopeptide (TPR) repeat protein